MSAAGHVPSSRPLPRPVPHPGAKGVGVVGLHEGRTLLAALNRTGRAWAAAGCDSDPARLEAVRRELPGLHTTTDLDEMLRHPGVEIVGVYTPDPLHAEHVERAFEAGKDVICTKPLVTGVQDARRVLAAARRTGRRLMVGQSTRFFEPFIRQRRAFEAGETGTLELADAHYIHRMDWYYEKSPWAATDTDWIFLGVSHPLDLLRWYLGPVREVQAYGSVSELGRRHGLRGRDVYIVNVLSEEGVPGRAMGHYGVHELASARNAIELMLYGSEGTSLSQYHDMRYLHTDPDGTEVTEDHLYAGRHYYFGSEVHGMHYGEFANYADAFATALIEGTPCSPDLDEGLEVFCLMEAARRSADSRRAVDVRSILEEVYA